MYLTSKKGSPRTPVVVMGCTWLSCMGTCTGCGGSCEGGCTGGCGYSCYGSCSDSCYSVSLNNN